MAARTYAAVDLGASSGRVVLGRIRDDGIELEVVHRFANEPRIADGHERWDAAALFDAVVDGLQRARTAAAGELRSAGVDTWGVDYAFVDARGALLADPVCYRDDRTRGMLTHVRERIDEWALFARTGVQLQAINTLVQLCAQRRAGPWPAAAERLLFMPDLLHFLLTGVRTNEKTIASTSQLLRARTRDWDDDLFATFDLPRAAVGPLIEPGTVVGTTPDALGLGALRIVAPAGHDTACAVAATPLQPDSAFLSSGTWSLLGVETRAPITTSVAAAAGLTNEAGAAHSNRLLKNGMGLWILESCRKRWGVAADEIVAAAARVPPRRAWIDADDPRFFHPRDMVAAVRGYLRDTGQTDLDEPAALTRVVLDSLAMGYAATIDALQAASGRTIGRVHVIGGGSRNDLLNQATADTTGRDVIAGPGEATALGNVLVQAIADGRFADLAEARAFVHAHVPTRRFVPRDRDRWMRARAEYRSLTEPA